MMTNGFTLWVKLHFQTSNGRGVEIGVPEPYICCKQYLGIEGCACSCLPRQRFRVIVVGLPIRCPPSMISRSETRPLSALISNLKHHEIFLRKSFGNRGIKQTNAISFKPRSCFDQLDSPRICARQEIFQEKRGVCFNGFAQHERSARKIRREENWTICPP